MRCDPARPSYPRRRFAAVFRHFSGPPTFYHALFLVHRRRLQTQHTAPIDSLACPRPPTPLRRLRTGSSRWPLEHNSSPPWVNAIPSTRCSLSDLTLEGFGVCTARRRLTPSPRSVPCTPRGRKVSTISRFQARREAVRSQGHHPRRLRLRHRTSEARRTLSPCPDIRGQHSERYILVFPHRETGLLHVDTAALSSVAKKTIIRDALAGLADLHDKRIFHTGQPGPRPPFPRMMTGMLTWFADVKPTNIMMDSLKQDNGDLGWCNVQNHRPRSGGSPSGQSQGPCRPLVGEPLLEKPRSLGSGGPNTPSDVYSFAIVVSSSAYKSTAHKG